MKRVLLAGAKLPALAAAAIFGGMAVAAHLPATRFVSTIQLAVQEDNPVLIKRSERLVVEQFAHAFDAWPEFRGRRYEVRKAGHEVDFYFITNDDVRVPMQRTVSTMIQSLNGRVRARGRSLFYRAALTQPMSGYLDVSVDDMHSKVRSISAQSVPLRDVLKELRAQLGSLSYLIPGECAERVVDWSFGEEGTEAPKNVDAVMNELASVFSLKCEKQHGSYIFSGDCHTTATNSLQAPLMPPTELLKGDLPSTPASAHATQVYFPLLPLGE